LFTLITFAKEINLLLHAKNKYKFGTTPVIHDIKKKRY
jgi:hypothetical protein